VARAAIAKRSFFHFAPALWNSLLSVCVSLFIQLKLEKLWRSLADVSFLSSKLDVS
jgi:hypothetical protein